MFGKGPTNTDLHARRVNEIAKADSVKHQIGGYRGAMKLKVSSPHPPRRTVPPSTSPQHPHSGGLPVGVCQAAGYRANDIRKAGTHSAWELRMAGYDLEQLKGAGGELGPRKLCPFRLASIAAPTQLRNDPLVPSFLRPPWPLEAT